MSYEWIKSIPNYEKYFNTDHQLIIKLINIDNYLKLYQYFGKTGVYFPINNDAANSDIKIVTDLIGYENYEKLYNIFKRTGIFFSSVPIYSLKKVWANKNKHIDYKSAARILDTSIKTIYNWRNSNCGVNE